MYIEAKTTNVNIHNTVSITETRKLLFWKPVYCDNASENIFLNTTFNFLNAQN